MRHRRGTGMRTAWMRAAAWIGSLSLLVAGLAIPQGPAVQAAAGSSDFTLRFSDNINGSVLTIGNSTMTCPTTAQIQYIAAHIWPGASDPNAATCPSNRAGVGANASDGALNNNNHWMSFINADVDNTSHWAHQPGSQVTGNATWPLNTVTAPLNSSMAALNLPVGSTVVWAGLYWGARLQNGTASAGVSPGPGAPGYTSSAINPIPVANYNRMQVKTPGSSVYETVVADVQWAPMTGSAYAYQNFADITDLVRQGGNGAYWGANIVGGQGADRYSGWSITVAYSAPGEPLRNVSVFDGFANVANGSPQNVTVSGFLAPSGGVVNAQLSMMVYEGDLGASGDSATLYSQGAGAGASSGVIPGAATGAQLATALSNGNNFFNSTSDWMGVHIPGVSLPDTATGLVEPVPLPVVDPPPAPQGWRYPAMPNMLGFDVKNARLAQVIAHNSTQATFVFSTSNETYFPGSVGLAIDLYAPDFTSSAKTVANVSAGAALYSPVTDAWPAALSRGLGSVLESGQATGVGDTLVYRVEFANTGQDPAQQVVSHDPLPAGVSYLPGSLVLLSPSAVAGPDQGVGPGGEPGGGSGSGPGSSLAPGAGAAAQPQLIFDQVTGLWSWQIEGQGLEACPSQDAQDHAPCLLTDSAGDDAGAWDPLTRTVTVNLGQGASADAGGALACSGPYCSAAGPGSDGGSGSGSGSGSGAGSTGGTETSGTGAGGAGSGAGSAAAYAFAVQVTGDVLADVVHNVASITYVTATTGSAGDFSAAPASVFIYGQADVSLSKTALVTGPGLPLGQPMQWSLTVTNDGPSDAPDVRVTDFLPSLWDAGTTDVTWSTVTAAGEPVDTVTACELSAAGGGTIGGELAVDPEGSASQVGGPWAVPGSGWATLTCSFDLLPAGSVTSLLVTGQMPASLATALGATAPGAISNLASVAIGSPEVADPDLSNNVAGASVAVTSQAQLQVSKVAGVVVPASESDADADADADAGTGSALGGGAVPAWDMCSASANIGSQTLLCLSSGSGCGCVVELAVEFSG